jgi:hypothetical protein
VTFERKNPPFPPEAGEGWGTLKYFVGRRIRGTQDPGTDSVPGAPGRTLNSPEKRNPRGQSGVTVPRDDKWEGWRK